MRRYEKYEFCKSVKCKALQWLDNDKMIEQKCTIESYDKACLHTAKDFHKWLDQNLFIISAPENEDKENTGWMIDHFTYDSGNDHVLFSLVNKSGESMLVELSPDEIAKF